MMTAGGVAKLIEECGELQQILGKKLAYFYTDTHPDGAGPINQRVQNEMGDVLAAIQFVVERLQLDRAAIAERQLAKGELFRYWQAQADNHDWAVDR